LKKIQGRPGFGKVRGGECGFWKEEKAQSATSSEKITYLNLEPIDVMTISTFLRWPRTRHERGALQGSCAGIKRLAVVLSKV